jgi:hypothetical protein
VFLSGDWRVTNGAITTITRNQWSYIFVGDSSWQNYSIDVDFSGDLMYPIAIVARAQDMNNLVQFQLELDNSYWIVRQKGERLELVKGDGTYWHTPSNRRGHIRVEVRGNFFTAYLDNELWLSITDSTFQYGKVGLGTYCDNEYYNCTTFDNLAVRELAP